MISPGHKQATIHNHGSLALISAIALASGLLVGCTPPPTSLEPQKEQLAAAIKEPTPAPKKLPRGTILAADYPDAWAWPDFESGHLSCRNGSFGGVRRPLVLIELGNTKYGLNGAAIGVGEYPDARTRMGRNEFGAYAGNSNVFIDMGLELCK